MDWESIKDRFYNGKQRDYYQMGAEFEDYVMDLFPADKFDLLHRTIGQAQVGRYVEDCTYPDLKFRSCDNWYHFWVECKYRSRLEPNGNLIWTDNEHLDRYLQIFWETGVEVFVIIGVGGSPKRPNHLHLISLRNTAYKEIFASVLKRAEIDGEPFESIADLWGICANNLPF